MLRFGQKTFVPTKNIILVQTSKILLAFLLVWGKHVSLCGFGDILSEKLHERTECENMRRLKGTALGRP